MLGGTLNDVELLIVGGLQLPQVADAVIEAQVGFDHRVGSVWVLRMRAEASHALYGSEPHRLIVPVLPVWRAMGVPQDGTINWLRVLWVVPLYRVQVVLSFKLIDKADMLRRSLLWRVCPGLVSARTGMAYAGIRTDATTYLRGAMALAEGMSIRATGRLLSVDKDTVNHWLPVLGRHCQHVMQYFFRR